MNQLAQNRTLHHRTSPRRLLTLLTVIILLTGFSVVAVDTQEMVQITPASHIPFSAFAGVFPGQPAAALGALGFTCSSAMDLEETEEEHCTLTTSSEYFSTVSATAVGGRISRIDFTPNSGSVHVADLTAAWGEPEIREYSGAVLLNWRSRGILAVAPSDTGMYSETLSVWRVYFLNAQSPLDEC